MGPTSALTLLTLTLLQAQPPRSLEFDVATVKPSDPNARGRTVNFQPNGNLTITNLTLKQLIAIAHHIRESQILGGPTWIANDKFDIQAKFEPSGVPTDFRNSTDAQRQEYTRQFEERVGSLLVDRFQLTAKKEQREIPIYALVLAKGGAKLQPAKDTDGGNQGVRMQRGSLTATMAYADILAKVLADQVDRPVVDKTGLTGQFNWKLEWTPDPPPGTPAPDISGPSLFTALQEQLGLKLEAQKAMMPVFIIERAEKPSAN